MYFNKLIELRYSIIKKISLTKREINLNYRQWN